MKKSLKSRRKNDKSKRKRFRKNVLTKKRKQIQRGGNFFENKQIEKYYSKIPEKIDDDEYNSDKEVNELLYNKDCVDETIMGTGCIHNKYKKEEIKNKIKEKMLFLLANGEIKKLSEYYEKDPSKDSTIDLREYTEITSDVETTLYKKDREINISSLRFIKLSEENYKTVTTLYNFLYN